jgi:uncharacterized protein
MLGGGPTMRDLIEAKRPELINLCKRYRVQALELFGSATGDAFDPATSDLDFLVQFQAIPLSEYADCYFGLLEGLVQLFGRPVDLVEAPAIRNPFFLQAIAPSRIVLCAA